jgi:hypothetical protein
MLLEDTAMGTRTSEVHEPRHSLADRAQADPAAGPPRTTQQILAEKYAAQATEAGKRRSLHHSPWFWGGVVVFVCAISVYVFTDVLAWIPLRSG